MRPLALLFLASLALGAAEDAEPIAADPKPVATAEDSARILAELRAEKAKRETDKAIFGDDKPARPKPDPAAVAAAAAKAEADAADAKTAKLKRDLEDASSKYEAAARAAHAAGAAYRKRAQAEGSRGGGAALKDATDTRTADNSHALERVEAAKKCAARVRELKTALKIKVEPFETEGGVVRYCENNGRE